MNYVPPTEGTALPVTGSWPLAELHSTEPDCRKGESAHLQVHDYDTAFDPSANRMTMYCRRCGDRETL